VDEIDVDYVRGVDDVDDGGYVNEVDVGDGGDVQDKN
jgi:hypothetical protein